MYVKYLEGVQQMYFLKKFTQGQFNKEAATRQIDIMKIHKKVQL